MLLDNRVKLRRKIRQRRRLLSDQQQQQHAAEACAQTLKMPVFLRARRIAFYIPADGELDPLPLLAKAQQLNKECYLPVLRPLKQQRLWFARWQPGEPLGANRYGIAEPVHCYNRLIPAWALDLVLTPLVAFDEQGNRLGMGGGYYDRSFAFLRRRQYWYKPVLAGYAYEFQRTSGLHNEQWDIPLELIITEQKVHLVKP